VCYDKEYQLRRQLKNAINDGLADESIIEILQDLSKLTGHDYNDQADPLNIAWQALPEFYHVSGFSHPPLIVHGAMHPSKAIVAEWGFIPAWVKNESEAYDPRSPYNNNLNVQSKTMFEKKAFAKAARYGRCVIYIDAYYESHHYKGKTYPFRIARKDGRPLIIAAICRKSKYLNRETGEEITKNTVASLTCTANSMIEKIHNNPAMIKRTGHRMLVILEESNVSDYLQRYPFELNEKPDPLEENIFQQEVLSVCQPLSENQLEFHSVKNLRDRKLMPYVGNVPEITEPYIWPDLDYSRF